MFVEILGSLTRSVEFGYDSDAKHSRIFNNTENVLLRVDVRVWLECTLEDMKNIVKADQGIIRETFFILCTVVGE